MDASIHRQLKDIYQSAVTADNYRRMREDYQEALAAFKLKERTGAATLPRSARDGVEALFNQVF